MSELQFKIGDLVMLKGGGPVMTFLLAQPTDAVLRSVLGGQSTSIALCCWFDKQDHYHVDSFRAETLVAVNGSFR